MREFWSSDSPELLEFWSGGSGATDGRSGVTGYSEWLDVATPPSPPRPWPQQARWHGEPYVCMGICKIQFGLAGGGATRGVPVDGRPTPLLAEKWRNTVK